MNKEQIQELLDGWNQLQLTSEEKKETIRNLAQSDIQGLEEPLKSRATKFLEQARAAGILEETVVQIKKERKRKSPFLWMIGAIVITIGAALAAYYLLGKQVDDKEEEIKPPITTVPTLMVCEDPNHISYENKTVINQVKVYSDDKDETTSIEIVIRTQFAVEADYLSYKEMMETSGAGIIYNNEEMIITDIEVLENDGSQDSEFLKTKMEAKSYYLDLGYTCNGETKTPGPGTDNNLGQGDNTVGYSSVQEPITIANNFFIYNNYEYQYNEGDPAAILSKGTMQNLTSEPLAININIKFYDVAKTLIGQYQMSNEKVIRGNDESNIFPGERKNPTFTFYDSYLFTGHTLREIMYITIEVIQL